MGSRRVLLWAGLAPLGWYLLAYAESPSVAVSRVAVIGDPAPAGGTFTKFESEPTASQAGDVAFVAAVQGGKAARGVFLASGGSVRQILAAGDPTPLGGAFQSFSLGRPSPTRSGAIFFTASVAGGTARRGIFLASQGTVTKIVAEGDATPIGGTFDAIDERPSIANDESVAWAASVSGAAAAKGIFRAAKGAITKVVAVGDPTPIGGTFKSLSSPSVGASDALVFGAAVEGGASPEALFLVSAGKITPLALMGDPAPGAGGGQFLRFRDADLNDHGQVPFRAVLRGTGATTGFYLRSEGGVTKIAARGDQLPEGRVLEAALGRPRANGRGAVAFHGHTLRGRRGDGWEAIYIAFQGVLTKVVAEGDSTPVGGAFGNLSEPFLSDSGAVVFRASVVGGRASEGIFVARLP